MNAEDRPTYARAVWEQFQAKAGTQRDMSPAEFWVISKWMDRSIPLPIVLRGLEEFAGRPRRLEAVVDSVNRAYAYWFQAVGGCP
jgi:hypothetical protein